MKDSVLRLDMIIDGESSSKMSQRRAASYGVNPEIRDPQMHKHTELGRCKLISRTVQWILIYKTKSFCFEKKWPLMEHNDVWFSHSTDTCVRESVRTWDMG